jgi:hypothetical protein
MRMDVILNPSTMLRINSVKDLLFRLAILDLWYLHPALHRRPL